MLWWLLLLLLEVHHSHSNFLSFMNETLQNHTFVDINDVGNNDDGSDSIQCGGEMGTYKWYFPSGVVLSASNKNGLYEQILESGVDLRRSGNATVSGMYRCGVKFGSIDTAAYYVGLYSNESGRGKWCSCQITLHSTIKPFSLYQTFLPWFALLNFSLLLYSEKQPVPPLCLCWEISGTLI